MPVKRFFFAWVDPGTAFDPDVHNVEDEKIVSFGVEQSETEFATMSIFIRNPRVGLLNAGRKLWAWLSYHNGSGIVPLFFGRLVAIPSSINKEVVQLDFIARPSDYGLQKEALAASMRVLPYYDPVFISTDRGTDPDVVLEGRTQVWHIDRISHELSVSDLIEGEDGVLDFPESDVPYDSVEINLDQPPIRRVHVEAAVPWGQSVAGSGLPIFKNWKFNTLAGKGLISGWPKPGTNLGGGWEVTSSSAGSPFEDLTDSDWATWYVAKRFGGPPFAMKMISSYSASSSTSSASVSSTLFAIVGDEVTLNLSVGYKADRQRTDTLVFDLVADSQAIVTMPEDDEHIELKISGNDVSSPLESDPYAPAPIGDVNRRSYFCQERGLQSIQYLIQLARSNIVIRSRAVKVQWRCGFDRAVEFSLRKNAQLHDRRLPGGVAVGKIVSYNFKSDGGEVSGACTIACCIGYGGAWTSSPGSPTYVEDGYVEDGYQFRSGQRVILGASDVGFELLAENANDDGLVFPLRAAALFEDPHNVVVETKPLSGAPNTTFQGNNSMDDCGNITSVSVNSSTDTGIFTDWLGGIKATVDFSLRSVTGGPFNTVYPLTITDLKLPKQIDLEAPPL